MNRNTGIIIIVVIAVLLVGALAAFMMPATTSTTESQTLMAFENKAPDHWVHSIGVIENITNKEGNPTTIFFRTWMQPDNGRVVMNLSEELGYGNEALPAGTTFRMRVCSAPYDLNETGQAKLNFTINGGDLNNIDNAATAYDLVSDAALRQLPATITEDTLEITTDSAQGSAFLQEIDGQNFICVELMVTVNADGTVTITPLSLPVLCELIAGIS